jgi:predicted patatin/cPLA2 family phospholipase
LELNKILKKNTNQEDKIKHYNQVLSRFLVMNDNTKTQKSQNTDFEQQMEPLKKKLSEYLINESKKMKRSETFDENPEEYDYDDDYLSVDNHSQGTAKN